MTERDQAPKRSPLAQSVERAGTTVSVEIYEDGYGGWLLEVVDEYGNSTVWEEPFTTDRDALDEALRTIEEEGIDSLVGSPSDIRPTSDLGKPLSKAKWGLDRGRTDISPSPMRRMSPTAFSAWVLR